MARDLTIGASAVHALMEFAVSRGVSRVMLAERARIDLAVLRDRDNRLPFGSYVALMRAAKEMCADPALALHFGEGVDCSELGMGGGVGGAGTFNEALAQGNRYAPLTVEVEADEPGERFQLRRVGAQLWLVDTRRNPNEFPELTESAFARMACSTRKLVGDREVLREVRFTHDEPVYRSEYERIFRTPVVFGAEMNGLRLDEAFLSSFRPPPSSAYVTSVLKEHAEGLLVRLEESRSTRGDVERLLTPGLQIGEMGMEAVAAKLGLSRQTLFRKLRAEGVTFEQVLDELRHRLALEYLSGGRTSVKKTAGLVGYSDPAAFSRAFKRWTGSSPSERLPAKH